MAPQRRPAWSPFFYAECAVVGHSRPTLNDMSDISEIPIETSLKDEFAEYSAAGHRLLQVRPSDDPAAIVAAIDTFVDRHQAKSRSFLGKLIGGAKNNTEPSLALGIVWGNQLVRELGWEWTSLLKDGYRYYVVASPDRSLAIYATYFVKECLDFHTADCTVMLSFNMLRGCTFPKQLAGSYTSVMPAVYRIIPKSAVR
jgi:hypothetical protein